MFFHGAQLAFAAHHAQMAAFQIVVALSLASRLRPQSAG